MDNCINCGIATSRCNISGRYPLDEENILSVVRAWVAPRTVNPSHHLCKACWDRAVDMFLSHKSPEDIPVFRGHIHVCIHCGHSLLKKQSHRLSSNTERDKRILNVISGWILPRTVEALSAICHSCWVRADRAASRVSSQSSTTQSETNELAHETIQDTIILPDYLRPIQTESKCFVEGCKKKERNRIPTSLRINLLNIHNYYVPHNNRICDYHINHEVEKLHLLIGPSDKSVNTFTASHIQDMLALKSHPVIYNTQMPMNSSTSNL